MFDEDEGGDFEYEEEDDDADDSAMDTDIENKYYNAKGILAQAPRLV